MLLIDQKGVLWQIDKWDHYVVYHAPVPFDATVIQGDFDGFTATAKQFDEAFGRYNMFRVSAQSTTYELTITELKSLMAKELGVSENSIEIRFKTRDVGDERFGAVSQETYGIEVVVNGSKPNSNPNPYDLISGQPE